MVAYWDRVQLVYAELFGQDCILFFKDNIAWSCVDSAIGILACVLHSFGVEAAIMKILDHLVESEQLRR